ncbi:MAG: Ig-like domain-containing protein, partial [Muribaculaceae bacterium]|nr:Ig-like domain-containing protein [Muribaculaceae bacterium]
MKKFLILISIVAASMFSTVSAAVGDQTTIVNQTLTGSPTLANTDAYSWGTDIKGMLNSSGLAMTNGDNKANDFENRDFVTFANALGNATNDVNISYNVVHGADKGQAKTYYTINYFNAEGNFVFGIQEGSGGWGFEANIITANKEGNPTTTALTNVHIAKNSKTTPVNLSVKFSGEQAIIAIDGGSYTAYTSSEGIKDIKLSVSGEKDYGRYMSIENFVVKTTEVAAAQFADYTVKYECDGNTIKEETKSGIVGSEISLIATETADFTKDDIKYLYVSNNANGKTVDAEGTTVVTITFREAAKYSWTVKANVDDIVIATGSVFEGESAKNIPFSRYIIDKDNVVWIKSVGDTESYAITFLPNKDGYETTVEYTKTNMTDGIFFEEAEKILTSAATAGNRGSNYLGGHGSDALYTLKPGLYNFKFAALSSAKTPTELTLKADTIKILSGTPGTKFQEFSTEKAVEITTETALTIEGTNSSNVLDYILITGEVKPVADYTVKFVDEDGNEINDAVTGSGFVGSTIEISEEYKKNIDKDGIPYIYDGFEPANPTIAEGGTTVIVKYHKQQDAKYTVNFVDQDGKPLKESVERTGDAGSNVELEEGDTDDITIDGVRYVYGSDNTEDVKLAYNGTSVIIITFKKVVKNTVKFVDKDGNPITDDADIEGAIGDDIELPAEYLANIYVDGKKYIYVENNAEGKKFAENGEPVSITYRRPEIGEISNIIDQTFEKDTKLTNTGDYTWGSEIEGMISTADGDSKKPYKKYGIFVTNNNDVANNYDARDFVTFTNPLGNDTEEVNISYLVESPQDQNNNNGYFEVNFYNDKDEFVFGIKEGNLKGWKYSSDLMYATEGGEKSTIAFPSAHMQKAAGTTVNITLTFNGTETIIDVDGVKATAYSATQGIKSIKFAVTGEQDWSRPMVIRDLKVSTKEVEKVEYANYTINYVCDNETIKSETIKGVVGEPITVSDLQKQTFFNESKTAKYFYTGDDSTGKNITADGKAVVNISFRAAETYYFTVKANVDDVVIATDSVLEGESKTVPYSRYIIDKNNVVWMKSVGDTQSYAITVTPDKVKYETTVEYTKTDMTDGIFFKEAEDEYYDGVLTPASTAGNRGSNNLGGWHNGPAVLYTLKPGTYNFKFAGLSQRDNKTIILKAGETEIKGSLGTKFQEFSTATPVEITTETELTIDGTDANNVIDYILITGKVYVPVNSVVLKGKDNKTLSKLELVNGEEYQLTATVAPENATDNKVVWESSDTKIATVVNGKVTAVGVGKVTITAKAGGQSATCVVKCYPKKGDATWSGDITITDAVDITNYVVGKKTAVEAWENAEEWLEFYKKGANANEDEDENITFADASAAVKLALEKPSTTPEQNRISAVSDEAADALVISGAAGNAIPVRLANSMEYVALQADIILPEGMNVDVKAGERVADSHTMMTKKFADNYIRVALFNFGNKAFADNDAPILEIVADSDIQDAGDIVIFNILASDSDATEYVLSSRTS